MKTIKKIKLVKSGFYPAPLFVNKNIGGGKIVAPNRPNTKTKLVKSGAGFTLIELLVVIAVIGLLASVVLVALNNTRVKARNTKRVADIRQIQKALELYFDDNGLYPLDDNDGGSCFCDYSHEPIGNPSFIPVLAPTYVGSGKLRDPIEDPSIPNLVYKYTSNDGKTYILQFNMEPGGLGNNCPDFAPNNGGWCTVSS